jgi:transposase
MGEELRDYQWALIEPLLPSRKRRGQPRADDRCTLNGILWVPRSRTRWKDLPPRHGSRSTCHRRLNQWQDQGVWEKIRLTFLGTLDRQPRLVGVDWDAAFLDGSFVPGQKGARTLTTAGRTKAALCIW